MMKTPMTTRILRAAMALGLLGATLPAGFAQEASTASLVVSPGRARAELSDEPPAVMSESPDQLQFNFTNAPLDAVLDYLGKAGGFVIVKSADVTGTVNIVSHRPISREQAVDLLNTVLNDKGYAAVSRIPNNSEERPTLKVMTKTQAIREGWTPIKRGKDPALIPVNDEIVTQIIPISHANAQELINNLQELLPEPATISANASSNAILLTGPQSAIHRMAQIIEALDESISSISELKVYRLEYAYAAEAATMVMSLFATQQGGRGGQGGGNPFFGRFGGGPGGFGGGGGRGGGDNNNGGRGGGNAGGQSAALAAQQRVTAVADERTNSVIVSAPSELLPTIEQLLESIDRTPEINTIVRVFPLRYSSAEATAQVVSNVFGSGQTRRGQGRGGQQGGANRFGGNQAGSSQRVIAESTVVAVADTRTNSVIVSAVDEVMNEVQKMIIELDENPARAKKVHLYSLKNANPETVTQTLQDMFASGSSGTRRTTGNTGANARGGNTNRNNTNNNRTNRTTGGGTNTGFGSLSGGGGGGGR